MAKKTDLSQETEATLIKGRLSDDSDVRPEVFVASYQTKRTQHISMLPYEKTGSR